MGLQWTIYCHTHMESGRRYVGLTRQTWQKRWNNHVNAAKRSTGDRPHFANAIRAYGKDAFSHEVLEACDTLESANMAEERWIEFYDTRNPKKGFNLLRGGAHQPHPIPNPWDRPGFREANLPKLAQISRSAASDPLLRASHMEACNRPDVKAKRRSALLLQFSDPEHRYALARRMDGVELSPEARARISESSRSRVVSDETRAKLSKIGMGRKPSPEHAAKLREMGAAHSTRLKARTHCKHGHDLADAYVRKSDNERICRTCSSLRSRARRSRLSIVSSSSE